MTRRTRSSGRSAASGSRRLSSSRIRYERKDEKWIEGRPELTRLGDVVANRIPDCTGPHRRLFVVCRADTTNRTRRPIFERQTFNAIEFGDVVRHQPEPEAAGVSGNEEIVGADHLASLPQVSTDLRVVGSSVVWKIEDCDVRKKGLEG